MLEINGVAWPRFIKTAFNPDAPGKGYENEEEVRAELLRMRDMISAVEAGGEDLPED